MGDMGDLAAGRNKSGPVRIQLLDRFVDRFGITRKAEVLHHRLFSTACSMAWKPTLRFKNVAKTAKVTQLPAFYCRNVAETGRNDGECPRIV